MCIFCHSRGGGNPVSFNKQYFLYSFRDNKRVRLYKNNSDDNFIKVRQTGSQIFFLKLSLQKKLWDDSKRKIIKI